MALNASRCLVIHPKKLQRFKMTTTIHCSQLALHNSAFTIDCSRSPRALYKSLNRSASRSSNYPTTQSTTRSTILSTAPSIARARLAARSLDEPRDRSLDRSVVRSITRPHSIPRRNFGTIRRRKTRSLQMYQSRDVKSQTGTGPRLGASKSKICKYKKRSHLAHTHFIQAHQYPTSGNKPNDCSYVKHAFRTQICFSNNFHPEHRMVLPGEERTNATHIKTIIQINESYVAN